MATLMAGHRKMEESKQVREIRRPNKRSSCIRGELRAVIRRPWLQSPDGVLPSPRHGSWSCACGCSP